MDGTVIFSMNKKLMEQHVNEIVRLSKANISDEYWETGHFLSDLPRKWELSILATNKDHIAGFIVASEKEGHAHIHKFVVDGPYQRTGLGTRLLDVLMEKTPAPVTLKVNMQNHKAVSFYLKKGFVVKSEQNNMYTMILNRA